MKSRSNSFKSKFRTFFKKKGDLKTEKISNMDKKEEIKSMPLQIQKVSKWELPCIIWQWSRYNFSSFFLQTQSSGAADSVVIIPLHSSDYNYEAAVDISKKFSLNADKKNGMTSKTGTFPHNFISAKIFWRDHRDCLIVELNVGQ